MAKGSSIKARLKNRASSSRKKFGKNAVHSTKSSSNNSNSRKSRLGSSKTTDKNKKSLKHKAAKKPRKNEKSDKKTSTVTVDKEISKESKPTATKMTKKKTSNSVRRERETSTTMKNIIKRAKQLWEKLRRHDSNKEARLLMQTEMMEIIRDNIFELVKKHDTARIIQCLLRQGDEDTRCAVFETLKDHVIDLSKLKYAKFVVKALFKYSAPKQRNELISLLYTNILRLMRHTEASDIVELAYNEYANALQRNCMAQEFYGTQFALFKDKGGRSLGDIIADDPEQSEKLIRHMKQILLPLLNKSVVKHSIMHRVLLEYMIHGNDKSRSEMIEGVKEVAVEMLHTRDGAKVALNCLWHGTPKDRKVLVKSFKGFVTKICKEEHGHLVLMGVFDCVDDTVLVTKAILSEIISSLEEICDNHYGRRVLLYLLNPRSSQHFTHQFVTLLTPGDANVHSKKPQETRWAELRSAISPALIKLATEKAAMWACQKPLAPLLIQISVSGNGNVDGIYETLTNEILSLVSDPCGHWVVKRLIANERKDQPSFAAMIMRSIDDRYLNEWSQSNRGCFVLTSLLKSGKEIERIANIVKLLQSEDMTPELTPGMKVLQKTLHELHK